MHPIVSDPRRLRVFLSAWTVVGLSIALVPYRAAGGPWRDAWPLAIWTELLAAPALATWFVCGPWTLAISAPRMLATVGAAALASAGLWLGAGRLWVASVAFAAPAADALFMAVAPIWFALGAGTMVVMSAVHVALGAADEGRAATQRALQADLSARNAELRALRAQVDPHFLFNCLHSISALTAADPSGARRMCLELADFFRDSLRAGAQTSMPLGTEAALVGRYLDIERVRFGGRLRTRIEVADDVADARIPPLLLQPLAENAVRHGIATLIDGGEVRIAAARQGGMVRITVSNPYDAEARRAGTGVGLANVRARVEMTWGARGEVRVEMPESRFTVVVLFPYEAVA